MAAQQATGRVCACGCLGSLDGRNPGARYTIDCANRLRDERDQKKTKQRAALRIASRASDDRLCGCGCKLSMAGLSWQAQFRPECVRRRKQEQWKKNDANRTERHRPPHPRGTAGWQRNTARDAPFVPSMKCKTCCDYPWARHPDRFVDGTDDSVGIAVGAAGWICRECHEPYAPEPACERGSVLRSSAGMAVSHGTLYGTSLTKPGDGLIGNKRPRDKAKLLVDGKVKGQNDGE